MAKKKVLKKALTLPELVQQIEAGTDEYRAAATELTQRIITFENWLSKLPGKVPTSCWEDEDERGEYLFVLRLRRNGKNWTLHHSIEHISDEVVDGGLLRDANVETKIRAIAMFPSLLTAMRRSQRRVIQESMEAARQFDEFAKSVGIESGAESKASAKGGK